jgi:hypothetical protein
MLFNSVIELDVASTNNGPQRNLPGQTTKDMCDLPVDKQVNMFIVFWSLIFWEINHEGSGELNVASPGTPNDFIPQ